MRGGPNMGESNGHKIRTATSGKWSDFRDAHKRQTDSRMEPECTDMVVWSKSIIWGGWVSLL